MTKCKHEIDEICTNADCPLVADYCPVSDVPDVCRHEDRNTAIWHTEPPKTDEPVICWFEFYNYHTSAMMKTYGIGYYSGGRWQGDFTNRNGSRVLAWTELPNSPREIMK